MVKINIFSLPAQGGDTYNNVTGSSREVPQCIKARALPRRAAHLPFSRTFRSLRAASAFPGPHRLLRAAPPLPPGPAPRGAGGVRSRHGDGTRHRARRRRLAGIVREGGRGRKRKPHVEPVSGCRSFWKLRLIVIFKAAAAALGLLLVRPPACATGTGSHSNTGSEPGKVGASLWRRGHGRGGL